MPGPVLGAGASEMTETSFSPSRPPGGRRDTGGKYKITTQSYLHWTMVSHRLCELGGEVGGMEVWLYLPGIWRKLLQRRWQVPMRSRFGAWKVQQRGPLYKVPGHETAWLTVGMERDSVSRGEWGQEREWAKFEREAGASPEVPVWRAKESGFILEIRGSGEEVLLGVDQCVI